MPPKQTSDRSSQTPQPRIRVGKPSVQQLNAALEPRATKESSPQKRSENDVLQCELSKMQKQEHDSNTEFNTKMQDLMRTNVANINARNQTLIAMAQKEISGLTNENMQLKKDKLRLEKECENRDKETKDLRVKITDLEQQNHTLRQTVTMDETESQEKEKHNEQLKAALGLAKYDLRYKGSQLNQKIEEIAFLKKLVDFTLAFAEKFTAQASTPMDKLAENEGSPKHPAFTVAFPSTHAEHAAPVRK